MHIIIINSIRMSRTSSIYAETFCAAGLYESILRKTIACQAETTISQVCKLIFASLAVMDLIIHIVHGMFARSSLQAFEGVDTRCGMGGISLLHTYSETRKA